MRVEMNGNESPVVRIEGDDIILTRPIVHFFDGKWTAEFIVEVVVPREVVYRQSFDVWISSLANLPPGFEGYERG